VRGVKIVEKTSALKLKVLANFFGAVAHVLWIVLVWVGMMMVAFVAAIFHSGKK
jgi:type IV secretory pathway VirB3-like protein